MFRKITTGITLTVATIAGFSAISSIASAESTGGSTVVSNTVSSTKAPNPLRCIGAADHKAAQASRLSAAQSELAALNARLAVAQQAGNTKAAERIQGHITKVTGHIATIQANQAKFATKCP
jgi:hypothetical protein